MILSNKMSDASSEEYDLDEKVIVLAADQSGSHDETGKLKNQIPNGKLNPHLGSGGSRFASIAGCKERGKLNLGSANHESFLRRKHNTD